MVIRTEEMEGGGYVGGVLSVSSGTFRSEDNVGGKRMLGEGWGELSSLAQFITNTTEHDQK